MALVLSTRLDQLDFSPMVRHRLDAGLYKGLDRFFQDDQIEIQL